MPEFQPVEHDPFSTGGQTSPLLMPVDHDPFGAAPGYTSDADLSALDPYETIKLRSELATKGGYTPEQAAANRQQTGMDVLYATPLGNALSARDAMEAKWRGQELERQGDIEGARRAFAEAAANTGMAFLPGMGRIGLGRAAEGAASSTRIFAGPMAKTANHLALSRAAEMERFGSNPEEIWHATGWERNPVDGKWRFEIDDSAARMKEVQPRSLEGLQTIGFEDMHPFRTGALSDFLEHPELYKAYPELAGIKTSSFTGMPALGSFDPDFGVKLSPQVLAEKRVPLHEAQHAVQDIEGFGSGTNPQAFSTADVEAFRARAAGLSENDARFRLYHRTGGEVEARNVEARADMTADERLATPPWLTEDTYRMLQKRAPDRR